MKKLTLNGKWNLKGAGLECEGNVPGSVYSFLLEGGLMDDPYFRDNELKALALMDNDFVFFREFSFDGCDKGDKVYLCCDGLDTLCEITLNGKKIAATDNMHRSYKLDVTAVLKENNEISLKFLSPVKFIKDKDKRHHLGGCAEAMVGFPHLRKAHCMFGWDWGPRLPDAGIFKDIYLTVKNSAEICDVLLEQKHKDGKVYIKPKIQTDKKADLKITLTSPNGEVTTLENNTFCEVLNPQLWWPNNLGEQPLYKVDITLYEDGTEVDSDTKKIGLRTCGVTRKKDKWGEGFAHNINGVDFFAMGADYVPEDNIFSRITYERTYELLKKCKDSNFNVIRVWGGGFYPFDFFYDICDELGLVVWQDLMFACANYLLTDDFEKSITAEIEDNVKRIRHHACLGLWCGNNEMEMFQMQFEYQGTEETKAHYFEMFERIIPPIVKRCDPYTFYWKASPSSGGKFDEPNSENRGDTHYWDVWHGDKPFAEYRKFFFRYASEFGFQSFPCIETVESFTNPSDRNIFSRIFEMHQRNGTANGKIMNYLAATYRYPTDFENLLYASQMLQATAIKYGVEHFRRNRGRCMGAVYWQLNDIWPVASWASIDYFGRLKALHYFAKRFFAPIMISCEETGEYTDRRAVSEEPSEIKTTAKLCVSNETLKAVSGTVKWQLRNASAEILKSGEIPVKLSPMSSKYVFDKDFDCDYKSEYLSYSFEDETGVLSEDSVLFTAPKHFELENPHLIAKIEGDEVVVTCDALALGVFIKFDCDAVLDDNYFNMNGGEKRVKITSGKPKAVFVKSVFDI